MSRRHTTRAQDAQFLASLLLHASTAWKAGDACLSYRGDAETTVARVEGDIVYLSNGESMQPLEGAEGAMKRGDSEVLKLQVHADGTATRLHVCMLLRGEPRRYRKTYVVGFDVQPDGLARGGANCCDTLERAEEVFANGVARAERRIAGEVA